MTLDLTPWNVRNLIDNLRDSVVSNGLGYQYVPLGKAANTEVKRLLWEIENNEGYELPVPDAYFSVHNDQWTKSTGESPSPWQCYKRNEINRFLWDAKEKFLFSVVRNPYTKLLSGYLDKVVKMQQATSEDVRDRQMRQHGLPHVPTDFADFVGIVCAQSDYETDIHWTSQKYRLLYDFIDYDYIGHFESLSEVFSTLAEKFDHSLAERDNVATHSTSALDRFDQYYTAALQDAVYERYQSDFEAFGYDRQPQDSFSPRVERKPAGSLGRFTDALGRMTRALIANKPVEARNAMKEVSERAKDEHHDYKFDPNLELQKMPEINPDRVTPRIPAILVNDIPAVLEPIMRPSSNEEIEAVKRVRDPFRLPVSGPGYVVDYARAFRIAKGVKTYLEVGSRDKGNIAWIADKLASDAVIIDVDLEHIESATKRVEPFIQDNQQYIQIQGNSVSDMVLSRVEEHLGGRKAELMFLDSSHVYSHFLDEFGKYWEFLAPGGVMFVHDIFWEGNDNQKGKAQVAELIDRHIPVYSIFQNEPLSRFYRRAKRSDVWGGFGIFVKP